VSKQNLKQLRSQGEKVLYKVPQSGKKVWPGQGLNLQLSWLTTVSLRGFDKEYITAVPYLLSTPVRQCLQRAVKNKQKQ